MPINASNLAWLLHHPHLKEVSTSATKVTCNSLVSVQSCILYTSDLLCSGVSIQAVIAVQSLSICHAADGKLACMVYVQCSLVCRQISSLPSVLRVS